MKRNKLSILDEQNYEYAVRALNDQKVRCSEEFEYWLSVDSNRALFQELSETKEALMLLEPEMVPDTEKAWRTLRSRISVRRRTGIFYWGVSAAAAFLLLIGYFLWMKEKEVVVFTTVSQSGEVMLRVGENESVSIDALTQEAHLSAELGATLNAGTLAYSQESQQSSVKMHTLATPRGRTFHLALSDGTEIWLNGETTLHYPSRFTGGERRVELLEGEAFFQVAPDTSLPFVVKNKTTKTQVLGTVFNVRAYPGENRSVTLLTGSVEVSDTFKANKVKLAPGENVYLDAAPQDL
ncbi:putative anti-sigma factor [Bacteroides pyogenes JCM 10003]|nr:putative anti-sigma factor [Bacteroides pyogenes JCM 10003]